jgi:general secretion pathway protein B
MSYILEALRKSEKERQLKQQALLAAAVTAEQPPRRLARTVWLVAALLLLLNGVVLTYFLAKDTRRPDLASERGEGKRADNAAAKNASLPDLATEPRASGARTPTTATEVQPVAAPTAPAEPPPLAIPTPAVGAGEVSPATPVVRATAKPPPVTTAPDKPARRKPVAGGDGIPAAIPAAEEVGDKSAYRLNVLAFGADPSERFAVINMTRYVKGDRLPDGAVVEEIGEDGVVLMRAGKRLRIAR